MKIYSNLLRGASGIVTAAACLFAMAFSTGCSADVDETLGYEMLPQNQKMIMRHLTFKGGKAIKFDTQNSTDDESVYIETPAPSGNFFETTLYRTDSLISSNITYGYLGVERSDTFGIRSAGFASTIMYMNSLDEETGFGYLPIFDTMKLVLSIDSYGGDTLTPVNYTVYELQKPLLGNLVSAEDTTAYIGCDLGTMYDASKPLFTFTFPNPDKNIGPSTTLLAMEPVDLSENGATWDFVRRLMLIPEDRSSENWDGYGREGMEVYEDEAKWIEFINGVCIVPDLSTIKEGERGALYDTRLSASGLSLQGRSRNPKDPTLIKDTVGMYYYFVDGTTTHGNISANSVRHDYTSGLNNGVAPLLASFNMESQDDAGNKIDRDSRTRTTLCYIEGVAGPVTELYFTDDFIDELKNLIKDEEGDFTLAGINQCLIYFYVTKADYDWMTTQANAATLTPYLNSSISRLGTYINYNSLTSIVDYDYVYEQTYSSTLAYDGNLNRSRACYMMNISGYMQNLFNYVNTLEKDDTGKYVFNENDEKYTPRTIYIGPEATAPYTFKRSIIQGMEGGTSEQAPIHIELTYSIVK